MFIFWEEFKNVFIILQTFSGSLDFSGKSQAHSDAYDDYDILYTNIGFELTNPKKNFKQFPHSSMFWDSQQNQKIKKSKIKKKKESITNKKRKKQK